MGYKSVIRKASMVARKERYRDKTEALGSRNYKVWGKEQRCLDWVASNNVCLTSEHHHLNGTNISWGDFRDNLWLRYGILMMNLPTAYNICRKNITAGNASL